MGRGREASFHWLQKQGETNDKLVNLSALRDIHFGEDTCQNAEWSSAISQKAPTSEA
jgi:hypothetical protein